MAFKIRFLIPSLLVAFTGCNITLPSTNRIPKTTNSADGANSVACVSHFYVGDFGDRQKAWDGIFYIKENLSIVAHLPTRSEFFIYVGKASHYDNDNTNVLKMIVNELREKARAESENKNWKIIKQHVASGKKPAEKKLEDFFYIRDEFAGLRYDSDRYSKMDRVNIVVYATCLTCGASNSNRPLYFVAFAMIPIQVPTLESDRLIGVLENFLQEVTLYVK